LNGRDVKAYVDWLAKKTGKGYRLITEAEWEYAARAKTTPGPAPRFGFGDDEAELCAHANGLDQSAKAVLRKFETDQLLDCSDGYVHTAPVGKFAANKFGLHDMVGNVKEWTADCFQGDQGYRGAPADGTAWISGPCQLRVSRGGSWLSFARLLRVAARYRQALDDRSSDVGFRVARTLP
jgi:formylglycine-generating enzyme required for sulfatase activity